MIMVLKLLLSEILDEEIETTIVNMLILNSEIITLLAPSYYHTTLFFSSFFSKPVSKILKHRTQ